MSFNLLWSAKEFQRIIKFVVLSSGFKQISPVRSHHITLVPLIETDSLSCTQQQVNNKYSKYLKLFKQVLITCKIHLKLATYIGVKAEHFICCLCICQKSGTTGNALAMSEFFLINKDLT